MIPTQDIERYTHEDVDIIEEVKIFGDKLIDEPLYARNITPEEVFADIFGVDITNYVDFIRLEAPIKDQLAFLEEGIMTDTGDLATYLEYIRLTNGERALSNLRNMTIQADWEAETVTSSWQNHFIDSLDYYRTAQKVIREYIENQGHVPSTTKEFLKLFLLHSKESYMDRNEQLYPRDKKRKFRNGIDALISQVDPENKYL